MRADADRDRQRPPGLISALREQPHIVRRDDIDAGERFLLDDETIDAAVQPELGIARDDDARRDHRPAVIDRGHRDRQFEQIDLVADLHHFARAATCSPSSGGIGLIDGVFQLVLDLAIGLAAHRHDGALLRADDARDHRHVVADDIVKQQRLVRLVDQRRDMADIDRLLQIDQLARIAQTDREIA